MRISDGIADPRVRRFLLPKRVVWTSESGVQFPENLLKDNDLVCRMIPGAGGASVLVDFGREVHGGVRLDIPTTSSGKQAGLRVRFGESVSEAMGSPNNDHSIHDWEVSAPWMGHIEFGCTGFRFVRVDLVDTETSIDLQQILAVALYRNLEYVGKFESSDPLLEHIWETGAYTVHLCMQDYVWDGIKRDRLVWIGDIHPESMVISTVFGDVDVLPKSLDYTRDRTPLPGWMNGISSYSLWWILTHYDWFRYHGDKTYLEEQKEYLLELLTHLESLVDEDGREHLGETRFMEWPTARDPKAIDAGLQALMVLALGRGAELCNVLGNAEAASRMESTAKRAAGFRRAATMSKQANALAVLAGMADAVRTNSEVLSRDPFRGLSTFYGYYVLQARAMACDFQGCLDLIRTYWGGMLEMGATTFWEGFEVDWMENSSRIDEMPLPGKRDIHKDFGDHCYKGLRHSLCHGWAAGPTAWLTEHVLGLAPASPGFKTISVRPHLGDLEWARGTLPTPHGIIEVEHGSGKDGQVHTSIRLPDGVRVSKD